MAYSVHFVADRAVLPAKERADIERVLQQISESVSSIPPASPFWGSMNDSLLHIDVGEFRVVYRIDPRRKEIAVVELMKRRARGSRPALK